MQKGAIPVLSGPSGAGKSTIINAASAEIGEYYFSISTTTRPPRDKERDGVDYYFVSKEEFEEDIKAGEFLEYAMVHGNYYGTSLRAIEKAMAQDKIVFLDIDVQGFESISKIYPKLITSVFVTTKNRDVLLKRLKSRGTETEDSLKVRLINALDEMKKIDRYDYLLINEFFEDSVEKLEAIAKVSLLKTSKFSGEKFIKEWNNG